MKELSRINFDSSNIRFTAMEKVCFKYFIELSSVQEVANELNLSFYTVRYKLKNIQAKLEYL